jgi:hypothetical protein
MISLDDVIRIDLSASATPVDTALTTVPLLIAKDTPTWTDSKACHSYSTVQDMLDDGFEDDSPTVAYARLLTGQGPSGVFYVGKKAGATLAASDLDAIAATDNSWYGFTVVQGTDDEIHTAATWALGHRKLQIAASATSSNGDASSTTSLAAVLESEAQRRTALVFSPASADDGIDAAWMGGQLPATPGTNNWAYVTLAGVPTDTLTSAQIRATIGTAVDGTRGNNANVYIYRAGSGSTQYGTVSSGEWIDNIVGEDWLVFNLQSALFSVLKNNRKVPMTDKGVSLLLAACHSVLDRGVVNGLISAETPYTVSAPSVTTLTQQQKIGRQAPLISIDCTLAGAVNSVRVVVNVKP